MTRQVVIVDASLLALYMKGALNSNVTVDELIWRASPKAVIIKEIDGEDRRSVGHNPQA